MQTLKICLWVSLFALSEWLWHSDGRRRRRQGISSLLPIVADSDQPAVPCGACRQVLAELDSAIKIIASAIGSRRQEFSLSDLLPLPKQGIL